MSLRRASLTVPGKQAEDRSVSVTRHLRMVGEGALDDSDSSDEARRERLVERRDMSEDAASRAPASSPSTSTFSYVQFPKRDKASPGPQDDNDWAEDEKEEDSVSPASSVSESDESDASTTAARSSSLTKRPRISRSRSSTIATLPASSLPSPSLPRVDSTGSVQTVTAGDRSLSYEFPSSQRAGLASVLAEPERGYVSPSHRSRRRRSQAFSTKSGHPVTFEKQIETVDESEMRFLEYNNIVIKEAEARYREAGWSALREILEDLVANVSSLLP